jgi:hypothetical protein
MLTRSVLPFAALLALALAYACSNQGEGEVCNQNAGNAGNDDCQNGLTCQSRPAGNGAYRCCPPNLTQATTQVCSVTNPGVTASPAPPEGGLEDAETTSVDAPTESSTDATAHSSDAGPADAPPEGTLDATGATDAPTPPAD